VGVLTDGRLALEEVHRFGHEILRLPTGLHWDITGLWREIVSGLTQAGKWARQHKVRLVSVGVDTWGVDWALVSSSGELVSLPHVYRDPRNEGAFAAVVDRLGVDRIYRTTGNQLLALNTLYSFYAHCQASPEIVAAADQLLFMPDLFHYWLCGQRCAEATIASTSQMVDCQQGTWATDLLDELQIPVGLLPKIVPPGTSLGTLLPEVADLTGLAQQIQVVLPPTHDTASAVAAVPADPHTRWCYLSSGTWSLLGCELDEFCTSEAAQAAMFTNELGIQGSVRFLKNIIGLWMVQECRRDLIREGQEFDYAQLTDAAAAAEPFRTLVDPADPSFQSPGEMRHKIAEFARHTGQPVPESPGQYIRCCLESLAWKYGATLQVMEDVLGRPFDVLHIVGGGGKNSLLNQLAANATGKTVRVGPFEATAIGNVLTQALAAGAVADLAELREVVARGSDLSTYQPTDSAAWEAARRRVAQFG
jgi:rhamnulokinase